MANTIESQRNETSRDMLIPYERFHYKTILNIIYFLLFAYVLFVVVALVVALVVAALNIDEEFRLF